jgi:hypothetical protein
VRNAHNQSVAGEIVLHAVVEVVVVVHACLPHFPPAPPLRPGLGIKVKTPFKDADGTEHAVDAHISVELLDRTQAQRVATGESQLLEGPDADYIKSGGAVGGACVLLLLGGGSTLPTYLPVCLSVCLSLLPHLSYAAPQAVRTDLPSAPGCLEQASRALTPTPPSSSNGWSRCRRSSPRRFTLWRGHPGPHRPSPSQFSRRCRCAARVHAGRPWYLVLPAPDVCLSCRCPPLAHRKLRS